jgi:(2R)-sulfolactate sulfo-lyase subunit alpha
MIHFLVHGETDNVAVAVVDVSKGDAGRILNMETRKEYDISALTDIPLGHKVALADLAPDDTVIKYDHDIGRVVAPIKRGEHVHVHNVKTKRW